MIHFPERLTLTWLKSVYKRGEVSPSDVVDEIIARSLKYMEKNIWIVMPSHDFIDGFLKNLPPKSSKTPLWGIPFAVKDNIDLEGLPTTAACPDFSYVPKESSTVVKNLIAAGAIPVGKTNLDQFATGLVGMRSPYGECHNAYQDNLISGGSSSGSAVALALGMCCFSLGTDTAGSGRVPAMLNSVVGYKPPVGAWSTKGVVPACESIDCVTVFANSLGDALSVDKFARSYDEDCIWSKKIERKGAKLPSRILVPSKKPEFFGGMAEVYEKKWNDSFLRLRSIADFENIPVEEIDCGIFEKTAAILYDGAYVAERWAALKDFVEKNPGKTFHVTERILSSGGKKENTAARLFEDFHAIRKYRHEAEKVLRDAVLVFPTAGGTFTRDEVRENPIETNSKMGLYTNHCNLLDLAAVAVPENSLDRENPFGITIFSLGESEELALALAERFLSEEKISFAVCGLHKKGYSLEKQLVELGADFERHEKTSPEYRLFRLKTIPERPGLVRSKGGGQIAVDIYRLPRRMLGSFMENVASPLTIGDVKISDGSVVKGVLCEESAVEGCEECTQF